MSEEDNIRIVERGDGKLSDNSINVILNINGTKTGLHLPVSQEMLEALKPNPIIGKSDEKHFHRREIVSCLADAFLAGFKLHFEKIEKDQNPSCSETISSK